MHSWNVPVAESSIRVGVGLRAAAAASELSELLAYEFFTGSLPLELGVSVDITAVAVPVLVVYGAKLPAMFGN